MSTFQSGICRTISHIITFTLTSVAVGSSSLSAQVGWQTTGSAIYSVDGINVGIGINPFEGRLHVEYGDLAIGHGGGDRRLILHTNNDGSDAIVIRRTDDTHPASIATTDFGKGLIFKPAGVERVRFTTSGNVGIGTTSPQHKLSVNGTIGAKEVIVTNTGWADYVFKPDYRLMPLGDVRAYIAKHRRLPEMPSEAEVKETGVSVGEMQAKLLAKIEELTLYVIELDKRDEALQRDNQQLREIVKRFSALSGQAQAGDSAIAAEVARGNDPQ
jgi:hypothetical protein